MNKRETGKIGEKLAIKYLENLGYKLLETNYQKREGEIDLIMEDLKFDEIVFIEVKTRSSNRYGYPEEHVDYKKIDKIMTVAQKWLREKDNEKFWRVDIISVEMGIKPPKIKHFKNIT